MASVRILVLVLIVSVVGSVGPCIATTPPPPPAVDCGRDAGGALCAEGLCCSAWGFCGTGDAWCGEGCQSGPCIATSPPPPPASPPPPPPPFTPPPPLGPGVGSIITESDFDKMLLHRNDVACPARGFYTYDDFIEATKRFPAFGNTGNDTTRRIELAAFMAQTSHETTGGWATAPGGPYAWGYCFLKEIGGGTYCDPSQWPCADGKQYYGRGPIQLSWNYNYGQAGEALGFDGIGNPDIVETDPLTSFETAVWFWMTPQFPKPSCHDVMTGEWTPSPEDIAAGRLPGFGLTTNIINGGLECGFGPDKRQEDRIGFYKRYLDILGVSDESNLDCNTQTPYGFALSTQPHPDDLLVRAVV